MNIWVNEKLREGRIGRVVAGERGRYTTGAKGNGCLFKIRCSYRSRFPHRTADLAAVMSDLHEADKEEYQTSSINESKSIRRIKQRVIRASFSIGNEERGRSLQFGDEYTQPVAHLSLSC